LSRNDFAPHGETTTRAERTGKCTPLCAFEKVSDFIDGYGGRTRDRTLDLSRVKGGRRADYRFDITQLSDALVLWWADSGPMGDQHAGRNHDATDAQRGQRRTGRC